MSATEAIEYCDVHKTSEIFATETGNEYCAKPRERQDYGTRTT